MNLRQLRYFVKVVDAGNMTRAAEALFVAQPALGMQIRQLEEDLGVALLVRHSRGVEPTPAGELLHRRAVAILASIDEARRDVASFGRDRAESIRLGLTPMLMLVIGPEIAVNVRERLPKVFLSLVEDMSHVLVGALSRGELDFALAYDVPDQPQLSRVELLREDLVLVTPPADGSGTPVAFDDALDHDLALPEAGDTIRDLVVRTAASRGLVPRIGYEVRSVPAIKRLILQGLAAGVLPYGSVDEDVRAGRLAARPIVEPALTRSLFLASAARRKPFDHELALTGVIRASLSSLVERIGGLAHRPGDELQGA